MRISPVSSEALLSDFRAGKKYIIQRNMYSNLYNSSSNDYNLRCTNSNPKP